MSRHALALAVEWPAPIGQTAVVSPEAITVVGVGVLVVLIALSAFFSSSEIAIFSLPDHRVAALADDGVPGAKTLTALKSDPRRLLVTILVGNNLANIGMSSIATGLLGMYLGAGESVVVATFGVTSVVLLFGESAPKSYAVEHSESLALRVARPLRVTGVVLYPLVTVFDHLTTLVNRMMGSGSDIERSSITRRNVQELIQAGQRAGVFTEEEHRMLQRLLRFRNRIAKEAMVPRVDVVAVDVDAGVRGAIETCVEAGFERVPVYEETLDAVVGVVELGTLLRAREGYLDDTGGEEADAPTLRELAIQPIVVPESKDVDELLVELRAARQRMAIVVDEFGSTAGVVTIEDIVEEIVGEVLAEAESTPIRWLDDRTALVRGGTNVHTLNEELGVDLPEDPEYESVAGLVLARTGRLVDEGESLTYDDVRLVVERVRDNRVVELRVELPAGRRRPDAGRSDDGEGGATRSGADRGDERPTDG